MDSKRRSLAKAFSWRCIALLTTVTVTWFLTHSIGWAMEIGLADTGVKILIYYGHERAWNRCSFGRPKPAERDWQI